MYVNIYNHIHISISIYTQYLCNRERERERESTCFDDGCVNHPKLSRMTWPDFRLPFRVMSPASKLEWTIRVIRQKGPLLPMCETSPKTTKTLDKLDKLNWINHLRNLCQSSTNNNQFSDLLNLRRPFTWGQKLDLIFQGKPLSLQKTQGSSILMRKYTP